MVSIALRTYNSEIGDMIDHQQIEEAIAHCRHILEMYPKHVGTYRLLGKAYLEEKRYADASDILQRVLSSVPEDFIAHVGMSIIREDEGNLDAAIYHMERAFETQPSNHAIQDELRRLYASRDGIEPPRIRLTRGALARMYAHGHLYDQAIAELLAAISEDAQRFDLQNLLAEMYYLNGKKVDSAETCTKILEKLPYCLKANQLLTIILEENDRADDAERYRNRWQALEPYAVYTDQENADPDLVPESKIKIDHLEWEPQSFLDGPDAQPVWASSLGVTLEGEDEGEDDMPVWLDEDMASDEDDLPGFEPADDDTEDDFFSFDEPSDLQTLDDEEAEPAAEDWMREPEESDDFGLFADETAEPEAEEKDQEFDFLGEESSESEDDWMAEFAVPEATESEDLIDETVEMKEDWLDSSEVSEEEGAEAPEADEDDEDDWMASLEAVEEEQPEEPAVEEEAEEDWIASLETGQETTEEDKEETMDDDWLASLGDADEEEPVEPEEEEQEEEWIASLEASTEDSEDEEQEAEIETEEDDWLASLGAGEDEAPAEPQAEDHEEDVELPEFLKEAGWEKSTGELDDTGDFQLEFDDQQPDELEEAEIPDWIREMAPSEEEEGQPSLSTSEISAEADPEWLEELDQTPDSPAPDWLSELDEPSPPEETDVDIKAPGTGKEIQADEQDMAWLESLAAKHGIPDEELVTSPEQRADISEDHLPEGMREGQDSTPEEPDTDEDWLTDLIIEEEPGAEEEAEWLSELGIEAEVEPEAPAPPSEEVQAVLEDEDDFDMDWLDEIGKEAAEEAAATSIDAAPVDELEEAEVDEEWLADLVEEEEPEAEDEWLSELGIEAEAEAETPPSEDVQAVLEDEDDFDMEWLDEIGKEAAQEAAATSMDAAPDEELEEAEEDDEWLADLVEEEEPEAEDEWLSELGGEPEPEAEAPPSEDVQAVLEDEDDFDMDWLDEIGKEAAQEAAATSIEEPSPEEPEEPLGDETAAWLTAVGSELDEEPARDPDARDDATSSGVTDFLLRVGGQEPEESEQISAATHEPAEEEEYRDEMMEEMPDEPDWETEVPQPDAEEAIEEEAYPHEDRDRIRADYPEMVETRILDEDELMDEDEDIPDAVPTTPAEWQPESQVEEPVQSEELAEDEPVEPPAVPRPDSAEEIFETAKAAISKGNLDEAIERFRKLISKGKLVNEVIEEVKESLRRHPVNVQLWEVLGDAYLRQDDLQEALDSYTKAEELLR